jgi:hypothetical protein
MCGKTWFGGVDITGAAGFLVTNVADIRARAVAVLTLRDRGKKTGHRR